MTMINRIAALLLILVFLVSAPANALFGPLHLGGGAPGGSGQTVAGISDAPTTVLSGAAPNSAQGALSVTMSPTSPPFSGTLAVTGGTDAASFTTSGSNLDVSSASYLCTSLNSSCSYSIQVTATPTSGSISPATFPISLTTQPDVYSLCLSQSGQDCTNSSPSLVSYSFSASTPNAVVGYSTNKLSTGGTPGTNYALVGSGADYWGNACPSAGTTNFQLSGSTVEANSSGLSSGSYGVCEEVIGSGGAPNFTQLYTLTAGTPAFSSAMQSIGDSITSGEWAFPQYNYGLANASGWALRNPAVGGYTACNATKVEVFTNVYAPSDWNTVPATTILLGANDAVLGVGTPGELTFYENCLLANAAWAAIPTANKVYAANAMASGSWSAYTLSISGNPWINAGLAVQSSNVGDSLTFPITVGSSGTVWIFVNNFPTSGTSGSFTWAVDGGSATTIAVDSNIGSAGDGVAAYPISVSAGSHSIKLQISALSGAPMIFYGLGTNPSSAATHVYVGGVLYRLNDQYSSTTATYNSAAQTIATTLASGGLNVTFVPVRNYVGSTIQYIMQDDVHPSPQGQQALYTAFNTSIHPPSGVVMSKSFFNSAGASTPAGGSSQTCYSSGNTCFPVHTFVTFAEGAVPSGSIAVPTVGGNPIRYQADRCARPWHDGSASGCQFSMFIPQLSAGAAEQVVWTVTTGSYPNSSSCAVSCITANSNLQVQLTGLTPTYWMANVTWNGKIGFYVSGGSVTSGVVSSAGPFGETNGSPYTFTIQGCSGTAPTATLPGTVAATTVTITNPGSGCPTTGSGSFVALVNTALNNGAYSSSNYCGIVRQYMQGPVADAWEIACRFNDQTGGAQLGFPGPVMRAFVEDWKNADGTVYAIKASAVAAMDQYQHSGTLQGYTFDMNWLNGASCIRCASSGYIPLTRQAIPQNGSIATFESDARPDWIPVGAGSATSAELNAVIPTFNSADQALFKASHAMLPISNSLTISPLVITQQAPSSSTYQSAATDAGSFISGSAADQDSNSDFWSGGGGHEWTAPTPANGVDYYTAAPTASDRGMSWLQNVRVAAAVSFTCQAGMFEPATRNVVNLGPTGFTPPSGMTDPARTNASTLWYAGDMVSAALACPGWRDQNSVNEPNFDYTHYVSGAAEDYIYEGEEWTLAALEAQAATESMSWFPQVTLSSGVYYPVMFGGIPTRGSAWALNVLQEAVKYLPSADISAQYFSYELFNINYPLMAAMIPYTGSIALSHNVGNPGPWTKLTDFTSLGWPMNALWIAQEGPNVSYFQSEQFMDLYYALVTLDGEMKFPGESSSLDSFANEFLQNYIVTAMYDNLACPYNIFQYVLFFGDENGYAVNGWAGGASAGTGQFYSTFWHFDPTLQYFSGKQEVQVTPQSASGIFQSTEASASASSGATTIGVTDMSQLKNGDIIFDCGQSCTEPSPGAAPLTGTGALLPYTYISAVSCSNTTGPCSGPGTITISCGDPSGSCSGGVHSPGIVTNDILLLSKHIDYPDSDTESDVGIVAGPWNPMPSGSVVKPVLNNASNSGWLGLGPWPMADLSSKASDPGYVWCPDLTANSYGTTGKLIAAGGTCGVSTPITFTQSGAQYFNFAPNSSGSGFCPALGEGWEYGGTPSDPPQVSPAAYVQNQYYGVLQLVKAILGSSTAVNASLSTLAPIATPYNSYGVDQTYWAYDSAF